MRFGRIFASFLLAILVFLFSGFTQVGVVNAQEEEVQRERAGGTILPATNLTTAQCRILMDFVAGNADISQTLFETRGSWGDTSDVDEGNDVGQAPPSLPSALSEKIITHNDILACGIRTGAIKLWMVPFYIRSILEFVVGLAGLIAVGGVVYGGYLYMFSGVSDDKEKGKKAILYGVVGMVLTLVAWGVVTIFINLLTRL